MPEQTFEIIDGVRRAKSYELLGRAVIPAEIIDEEGNTVAKRDVPIDSLRVLTKRSIDVSTQRDWERFMKTFNQVKAGLPTPCKRFQPKSQEARRPGGLRPATLAVGERHHL